jgi:alpha-L-rhamnosidase
MDIAQPRLSWVPKSTQRGQEQTAYRVLAASSPEKLAKNQGDLWDTGKVRSNQTLEVVYAGKALMSRREVWWKVRVWDRNGRASGWSEPSSWTMGLLAPSDWQAKWIADPAAATNAAARGPLNGYHSEIAFASNVVKWVALDLGQAKLVDGVRLSPARPYDWQPDTAGFLFPIRFQIEIANREDFSDARVVVNRASEDEPNPGTNAPLYQFPAVAGRFVKLTVTQLGRRDSTNYALALAEMQVWSEGKNVAEGAKVLALDSIETGAWAKANLTDGVQVTVPPGGSPGNPEALPATMVRKYFNLPTPVRRATAYASALGLYEFRLNGQRVGDQLLAPEWTSYRKRVQYQVYDVTRLVRTGENVAAALLGEGWYAGRLMAMGRFAYGMHPSFLLQLEIELTDGSRRTILTDGSWRSTIDGPIRSTGIYDGEVQDARRDLPGWDAPGFADSSWHPVKVSDIGPARLMWQRNEPIRITRELKPATLAEPKPGVYVFDLSQNMVGWCRIRAVGAAGQTVTVRHAEMLNDDGTLYTDNLRGAPQIDRYTPRTDGEFVFEPHFTYHGFRYVELTGLAKPPTTAAVQGRVFHSTSPDVGAFECSDPSLNQLMRNIIWTQRANLMSSPNDCPQRDERFGWMGDIQSFAQTAIFNMDMAAFFTKFAQDIRDDQADDGRFPDFAPHPGDPNKNFSGVPAWGDAGTIVPWRAYQNYGDTRLISEHFEAARRWVEYIRKLNPDLVWAKGRNNDYNDWLNGDGVKQAGWPTTGGSVPQEVFATAFFAHSTELVAKMAKVAGRPDEARRYRELFEQIKAVFNQRFVKPDGHIQGDTQGGYALALNFDLLPEDLRPAAGRLMVENIRRYGNHLSTGIQTTHRAMLELGQNGYEPVAWQVLTNRTFPSWLYMIDNGATTIWERWDGYVKGRGFQDAGMNSFNHWAFGAVGEWMWRNIAGLNPDEAQPGWKHFIVAPQPGGGVTWAKANYQSVRGPIAVSWKIGHGTLTLQASVPPNTTATIRIPTTHAAQITESGRPIASTKTATDFAEFEVTSGSYNFVSPFSTQ